MKARIAHKLRMVGAQTTPITERPDQSLADSCVTDFLEKRSYSVQQVSELWGMSEDWVLQNVFRSAPAVFRCGKALRIPESSLKIRQRELLVLIRSAS